MAFQPGQSGNPAGRPPGLRDKRAELRAMLEPHAPDLVAKVVAKALEGDTTALRICLDRLIPVPKAKDEAVSLPLRDGSLADKGEAVLGAIGDGEIPPDVGAAVLQAIASQARIVEVDEIERRLTALEAKHAK